VSKVSFRCTIHDVDVSIEWRQEKPENAYAACPLCATEDAARFRTEARTLRIQRDAMLQMIDLAKSLQELSA